MEPALELARALQALVALLGEPTRPLPAVRAALRRLASTAARCGAVVVSGTGVGADRTLVRAPAGGVGTGGTLLAALGACLTRHGITELEVRRFATPRDLLGLARYLASENNAPLAGPPRPQLGGSLWGVRMIGVAERGTSDRSESTAAEERELRSSPDFVQRMRSLVAEAAARKDVGAVGRAVLALLDAEQEGNANDVRAASSEALDALAETPATDCVVDLLASSAEPERYRPFLRRAGDKAVRTLFDRLVQAEDVANRRVYFDAIVELRFGGQILVEALEHQEWYIVRNAANLLGAMCALEADGALARLETHEDTRVRLAALEALALLGTETSRTAIRGVGRNSLTRSACSR